MFRSLLKILGLAKVRGGDFDPSTYKFSDGMIAEAKANPNGWVYLIDGVNDPTKEVAPERIFGAFKVDAMGLLTREFKPNSNYRRLS